MHFLFFLLFSKMRHICLIFFLLTGFVSIIQCQVVYIFETSKEYQYTSSKKTSFTKRIRDMTLKNFRDLLKKERILPPACGLEVKPCEGDLTFRRYDGSCNNINNPTWGVPNSTYVRLLPSRYSDGIRLPRKGYNKAELPSARLLRTSLFGNGEKPNELWNINAMNWGQFMAHDMSLLKEPSMPITCCSGSGKHQDSIGSFCFPINVTKEDSTMGNVGIECLNFTRTVTDKDMGCSNSKTANQINVVSSYLDLSQVYGVDEKMAKELRTFTGGLLATETRNGVTYPPKESSKGTFCPCSLPDENVCYKTGDSRANQNPQLAILQILFVREHNRIANKLASLNPHWDDERLYQEARRINIACYQHITYYGWLPIFLGDDYMVKNKLIFPNSTTFVNDYKQKLRPEISSAHSQGAFRFYHTSIVGQLNLLGPNRDVSSTVPINNWWNRPEILENDDGIKKLTMGMIVQNFQENDDLHAVEITDHMFNCRGQGFGIDLRAADFQRDRDHGLGYYNEYRKYCGLKTARSFDDYKKWIPEDKVEIMKKLYKNYRDVDLSVGGALETFATDAQCGLTFQCIMKEQFLRTRRSDRLWYENEEAGLTEAQLAEVRKSTAARIFCDNGDGIESIQPRAFTLIFDFNPVQPCSEIPIVDLNLWKEEVKTV